MELDVMAVELARLSGAQTWDAARVAAEARAHYGATITGVRAKALRLAIRAVLRERGVLR